MNRRIGRETKSVIGEAALPTFYEFFAGGGMVRAGLQPAWRCAFANDFDLKKSETYRQNWGDKELRTADVRTLSADDLPSIKPDLVWASFPCQDLSLAGGGAGLKGNRSGTFWPFWELIEELKGKRRSPEIVVLENVCGTLTSHGGKDFRAIVKAFADLDFDVGAMVIDAELFVPQSRPRLFFVGVPRQRRSSAFALESAEHDLWHPPALRRAFAALPRDLQERWIWWNMPAPPARKRQLSDLLEIHPEDVEWRSDDETDALLEMMSPLHQRKVAQMQALKREVVGTLYRRTRTDEDGNPVQRVEVRFDEIAGCLRTPAGGSSRQAILVVNGKRIRSRLLSARETARLMGLRDSYVLPERYNEAYHLTGDGVVVPVVKHLSDHVLLPFLAGKSKQRAKAA